MHFAEAVHFDLAEAVHFVLAEAVHFVLAEAVHFDLAEAVHFDLAFPGATMHCPGRDDRAAAAVNFDLRRPPLLWERPLVLQEARQNDWEAERKDCSWSRLLDGRLSFPH